MFGPFVFHYNLFVAEQKILTYVPPVTGATLPVPYIPAIVVSIPVNRGAATKVRSQYSHRFKHPNLISSVDFLRKLRAKFHVDGSYA